MTQIPPPASPQLKALMGEPAFEAWRKVNAHITTHYEMETLWFPGRKENVYEFKYRRGGKTLCALYPREGSFGFMVIFGAAERDKFAARRDDFSPALLALYDAATVYHDGLWLMLPVEDDAFLPDIEKLLPIKRRYNRKAQS